MGVESFTPNLQAQPCTPDQEVALSLHESSTVTLSDVVNNEEPFRSILPKKNPKDNSYTLHPYHDSHMRVLNIEDIREMEANYELYNKRFNDLYDELDHLSNTAEQEL